jgi:DNA-binding NarL/FixJ family response regulator
MRILIAAMQPLLREMIESAISAEGDMVITGPIKMHESIYAATERLHPDVVITGPAAKCQAVELLGQLPRLKVFTISGNGCWATKYELKLSQDVLADISLSRLIGAIRLAVTNIDAGK